MFKVSQYAGALFRPKDRNESRRTEYNMVAPAEAPITAKLARDTQPTLGGGKLDIYIKRTVDDSGHVSATLNDDNGQPVSHISFAPDLKPLSAITVFGLSVPGQNYGNHTEDHEEADERHSIVLDKDQYSAVVGNMEHLKKEIADRKIVYSISSSFGSFGKVVPNILLKLPIVIAAGIEMKRGEKLVGYRGRATEQTQSAQTAPFCAHNCITVISELLSNIGIKGTEQAIIPNDIGDILREHAEAGRAPITSVELKQMLQDVKAQGTVTAPTISKLGPQ